MSQFDDVERLMVKARNSLILNPDFVFFGTLALRLKMYPEPATETADTDGVSLRYNPDYVRDLTHDRRVALIAHETMHCALGHPMRLGGRDFEQFNEAADYALNLILKDAGLDIGPDWLCDDQYRGMAAEEIYARRKRPPSGGGGTKPGNVGGAGVFSAPTDPSAPGQQPMSQPDQQALARDWQIATMQAASVAKRAGNLAGSTEEMVEALKQPRVDWREALKRFVTTTAQQDYSWVPPNRRYAASGIYLPSLHSEKIGAIVFAIDTSASMDVEQLKQALAELNAIAEEVQPEIVHVIECDTKVGHEEDFAPDDYPITHYTMKGRGGTAFAPVFERIAERGIEPDCLIYFTDLDSRKFGNAPDYPVLWASTEGVNAPFGEIIQLFRG